MFPELHWLYCIALTIPLATAWPERGFSTLCHVKNKQRNRLLDVTLNALLNVSINGPKKLTEEDAQTIAEKWQQKKNRRRVTKRALKAVESAFLENDEDMDSDDAPVSLHEIETETAKFLL